MERRLPGGDVEREAVRTLRERGLLLLSDNHLPSVTTLVAGEPIRGSWWAHPRAHAIFAAASALGRDPDAIAIPLVAGKMTFVHRRLWPALLAVARARDPWQTSRLSAPARALLKRLGASGELQASGAAVRELERRLLVKSREAHTESGAHAKIIEPWERWARRVSVAPLGDRDAARRALEQAAAALAPGSRPPVLPWTKKSIQRLTTHG